jgi:hypothetical protein
MHAEPTANAGEIDHGTLHERVPGTRVRRVEPNR